MARILQTWHSVAHECRQRAALVGRTRCRHEAAAKAAVLSALGDAARRAHALRGRLARATRARTRRVLHAWKQVCQQQFVAAQHRTSQVQAMRGETRAALTLGLALMCRQIPEPGDQGCQGNAQAVTLAPTTPPPSSSARLPPLGGSGKPIQHIIEDTPTGSSEADPHGMWLQCVALWAWRSAAQASRGTRHVLQQRAAARARSTLRHVLQAWVDVMYQHKALVTVASAFRCRRLLQTGLWGLRAHLERVQSLRSRLAVVLLHTSSGAGCARPRAIPCGKMQCCNWHDIGRTCIFLNLPRIPVLQQAWRAA